MTMMPVSALSPRRRGRGRSSSHHRKKKKKTAEFLAELKRNREHQLVERRFGLRSSGASSAVDLPQTLVRLAKRQECMCYDASLRTLVYDEKGAKVVCGDCARVLCANVPSESLERIAASEIHRATNDAVDVAYYGEWMDAPTVVNARTNRSGQRKSISGTDLSTLQQRAVKNARSTNRTRGFAALAMIRTMAESLRMGESVIACACLVFRTHVSESRVWKNASRPRRASVSSSRCSNGKRNVANNEAAVVAATLYAACRLRRVPRTFEEVARGVGSSIPVKAIKNAYLDVVKDNNLTVPPPAASDYVPRYTSLLFRALSSVANTRRLERKAIDLCSSARDYLTAGAEDACAAIAIAASEMGISSVDAKLMCSVTHCDEKKVKRSVAALAKFKGKGKRV